MPVTDDPPLLVTEATTVMAPLPGVNVTTGAPGTVAGAASTGVEAKESPTAFTALISTGYSVPLAIGVVPSVDRVVITIGSTLVDTVYQVAPASVEYW